MAKQARGGPGDPLGPEVMLLDLLREDGSRAMDLA